MAVPASAGRPCALKLVHDPIRLRWDSKSVSRSSAKSNLQPLAAALEHHRAGRLAQAEKAYRQVLEATPDDADALHMLGVVAHQMRRSEEAADLIGQAIARNPSVPAFHNNLGNALRAQGRLEQAEAAYRRALQLKSDHAEAHYNLGIVLHDRGAFAEAVASLESALRSRAEHPQTYYALGNALRQQGRAEEALSAYRLALSLAPGHAEAHLNAGNILKALGRGREAMSAYRQALACRPDFAEAHRNLGAVLLELGQPQEAVAACRRALELKPIYAEAQCTLGHALRDCGLKDEAEAAYRCAIEMEPSCAEARLGLLVAAVPLIPASPAESAGAVPAFLRALEELRVRTRSYPGELAPAIGCVQPFHLPYGHRDVTGALCAYGDLVCTEAAMQPRIEPRTRVAAEPRRDRLRLALISGCVRRHPVWDVISRGIVGEIDRSRFEIFIYHTGTRVDEETEWAKLQVDRFVQGPMGRSGWLEQVAQDRPDVILYPEVGMDPMTCGLAALRLAPIQAAAWGHPVTTGLPTIDLYFSGELMEPSGAEAHYREKLLRLPGTGVCTRWQDPPSQPWGGPDRKPGVVRFALCQQPIKFDPADDRLLARIAKAAGPCELWLAAPQNLPWEALRLRERIATAFREEGLDPNQWLRTFDWLPAGAFSDFLDSMDVYLDSPAFSGYTTAWQAIHCGLPVVTLAGKFLRQRLATGLLAHAGVSDGIAESPDGYVEIAARWAEQSRHTDLWEERRSALRRAARGVNHNAKAIRALEEHLLAEFCRSARSTTPD